MSYEDSEYHNIDPEFDLVAIVRYVLAFKKISENSNMNNYKLLTYKETITGPYAK